MSCLANSLGKIVQPSGMQLFISSVDSLAFGLILCVLSSIFAEWPETQEEVGSRVTRMWAMKAWVASFAALSASCFPPAISDAPPFMPEAINYSHLDGEP